MRSQLLFKSLVVKSTPITPEHDADDGDDTMMINPQDYVDDAEPVPKGKGGHPGYPRLLLGLQRDYPQRVNVFRCAGKCLEMQKSNQKMYSRTRCNLSAS